MFSALLHRSHNPCMSAIKLNDEEFALLDGMSNLAFRLYVILRRHMDYATGEAGRHHRIRWSSIDVEMNVDAHCGVRKGTDGRPGVQRLRRAGARLVKAGLIKSLSIATAKEKQLIFFFPAAARGHSVKTQADRIPTDSPDRLPTSPKTKEINDMGGSEKAKPTRSIPLSRQDIRGQGKRPIKNKQKKSAPAALDYSSWPGEPSQQVMDDWLAMRKAKKAPVSQTVVSRFGKQLQLAHSAGHSVDDCLGECIERNWLGFKAAWITNQQNRNGWNGGKKLSAVDRVKEAIAARDEQEDSDTIDGDFYH